MQTITDCRRNSVAMARSRKTATPTQSASEGEVCKTPAIRVPRLRFGLVCASNASCGFLLSILAMIVLNGCGLSETDGKPQIGGILFQEDQFFRMIEIGMKDAAAKHGVQLSVNNSRNGPDEELRLIDTYIIRGVDAIVISPLSGKASIPALERAHQKGIKIITYNTVLEADFPLAYIESNQVELGANTGRVVRQYVEEKLGGKANVAVLSFETQHPETGGARVRGFLSQIEQLPGVKIVAKQDAWLQPDADNAISSILTAHPDLNIVWAANEGGTVGGGYSSQKCRQGGAGRGFRHGHEPATGRLSAGRRWYTPGGHRSETVRDRLHGGRGGR